MQGVAVEHARQSYSFGFLGWGVGGVPGIDGGLPGLDGDFEGAVDGITRTVSLWFCNSSWEGG